MHNQIHRFVLTLFNQSDSFNYRIQCIFASNQQIKAMGLNIKKTIKDYGLEVREVAKRMEISPTGLSQHINGNPSVEVLQRIADAIGCDVSELFEQPKKDSLSLTCPHCGKDINLKID